ncbi:hypothetical protein GCM10023347_07510 [Streptomyces chumphonensis]
MEYPLLESNLALVKSAGRASTPWGPAHCKATEEFIYLQAPIPHTGMHLRSLSHDLRYRI